MTFKAMVLDERDVLRGVVELESEAELTPRHVDLRPYGGDCDRKPGEYRWDRQQKCLMPLPRPQRAREGNPTLEVAYAFDLLSRWVTAPAAIPEVALAWLDSTVMSVDMQFMAKAPVVEAYRRARGLNKGDQ